MGVSSLLLSCRSQVLSSGSQVARLVFEVSGLENVKQQQNKSANKTPRPMYFQNEDIKSLTKANVLKLNICGVPW